MHINAVESESSLRTLDNCGSMSSSWGIDDSVQTAQMHMLIALDKELFFNQKVSIFFLFLNENICCGYSLEAPCRGASNEYPQHMFSSKNKKTIYQIHTLI